MENLIFKQNENHVCHCHTYIDRERGDFSSDIYSLICSSLSCYLCIFSTFHDIYLFFPCCQCETHVTSQTSKPTHEGVRTHTAQQTVNSELLPEA